MSAVTIAIIILVVVAVAAVVYLNAASRRRRGAVGEIPPGMRPAYSDEQLEKSVLERYMAWGLVLTAFFAVFFPIYWVNESRRLQTATEGFFVQSVQHGEDQYVQFCAECHGQDARGGAAPSPYGEGAWPAPDLTTIAARYQDSRVVPDIRDFVYATIERGRPGTPMPTWGAGFGGPLTDAQIQAITDWILANQVEDTAEPQDAADLTGEDLYVENCARCHGPQGEGLVGPSLVGVFERHDERTVLGILQNGVWITNVIMPPWQNGYMYPDTRYSDEALQKIVDYLKELQPATLPEDAGQYQPPGVGPVPEPEPEADTTPAGDPTEA